MRELPDKLAAAGRFAATLLLGAAILFCSLEITARLYLFGWAGLDLRRAPITRGLTPPGIWRDPKASGIGFQPNLDVFVNLVHLETNSQGFRDQEYKLVKPNDTFRVAVMGSSYTVPAGVEIELAFHSVLEDRLTQQRAPAVVEFINFASFVKGPGGVLRDLRKHALKYEPDLIIVCATHPVVPYYLIEWRGTEAGVDRTYRWPPEKLVNFRPTSVSLGLRSYFIDQWKSRGAPEEPSNPMQPPKTGPRPNDVVRKLGAISRQTGIPIVVARLEFDDRVWTETEERFAARIRDEGMHYISTLDAFEGTTPTDFWIHRLDAHPDARAHAIFADVIGEFLENNDLLGR